MYRNPFSDGEIESRQAAVRGILEERGLAGAVFAAPESVFWLTGLDHWGYFAPHLLILPVDGRAVLVTRAMERVTIENQVRAADFRGHSDDVTAAAAAAAVLREIGLNDSPLGIEQWTAGLSHGLGRELEARSNVTWTDISGTLVDELRLVKSEAEQTLLRQAAAVTDSAATAAIAAVHDGATEREVAASCLAAMVKAGGDPPGFGPFLRPGRRLGEEHATWGDSAYRAGEPMFLELSGCVARYHAPLGRLVHLGQVPAQDATMAEIAIAAFDAVLAALIPGRTAGDVYAAWQAVVDAAGLKHYRRHHCGYAVGIGFPPSWTGGNAVIGLKQNSRLIIREAMSFHVLSWLMGTDRGDYFLSNTVLVGRHGAEILTRLPYAPLARL
jgi:Xaa-Pro dipeptidase